MRQYYSRDKKRREDAKRKQQEEKRLKRMNRTSKTSAPEETNQKAPSVQTETPEEPSSK